MCCRHPPECDDRSVRRAHDPRRRHDAKRRSGRRASRRIDGGQHRGIDGSGERSLAVRCDAYDPVRAPRFKYRSPARHAFRQVNASGAHRLCERGIGADQKAQSSTRAEPLQPPRNNTPICRAEVSEHDGRASRKGAGDTPRPWCPFRVGKEPKPRQTRRATKL